MKEQETKCRKEETNRRYNERQLAKLEREKKNSIRNIWSAYLLNQGKKKQRRRYFFFLD